MARKITIGRGEFNDICIPSRFDTVSKWHADIEIRNDGLLIIIDHSSNGTFVNGVKLSNSRQSIKYGDKIQLSKHYDLSWSLVEPFLTKTDGSDNSGNPNPIPYPHPRETELFTQDVTPRNDGMDRPLNVRKIEIESAKNSWSWGGFLLSWIWALGHACWWPFFVVIGLVALSIVTSIVFLPLGFVSIGILNIFQLGLSIYLGIKGNSIAWANGCFDNLEHFKAKEHRWTIAGIIVLLVSILLPLILLFVFFVFGIAFLN